MGARIGSLPAAWGGGSKRSRRGQSNDSGKRRPIGVMGYGEGGLIGFYASAIDTRIDATVVSGYFQPREALWREPIYRLFQSKALSESIILCSSGRSSMIFTVTTSPATKSLLSLLRRILG